MHTAAVVTIAPASLTIAAGGECTLTAQATSATEATITGKTAAWSSRSVAVATVNGGVVTGITPGVALVTETIYGMSAFLAVTVSAAGNFTCGLPVGGAPTVGGRAAHSATGRTRSRRCPYAWRAP